MFKHKIENVIDKLKINIPIELTGNRKVYCEGLGYEVKTIGYKGIIFTASGKIMAFKDNLGGIKESNFGNFVDKVNTITSLNLSPREILEYCPVFSVDVKNDIFTDRSDCKPYISALKERADVNSRYRYIQGFKQKTCSYEESFKISTTTKKKKKSLSSYSKYAELIHSRHKEPDYFKLFSPDFLEYCKRLIRFEVRLNTFKEIRNAFGIKRKGLIYLSDLFNTNKDVIAEAYQEIILGKV